MYRKAFTLMEILVVVAIVSILVVLLLGGANRIIASSKAAKCSGNLRNIYVAAMAWSADNNGRIVPVFYPGDPNSAGSLKNWTGLLAPYLGRAETNAFSSTREMPVYACPSAPQQFGYGYNYLYLSWVQDSAGKEQWATMSGIAKPARTVFLADTDNVKAARNVFSSWRAFLRSPVGFGWAGDCRPAFVHPGKTANVLWLDGHVSAETSDSDFWKNDQLWDRE